MRCRKLHLNFVRWSFFVTFAAMEKKYTADELSYIGFVARKYCNLCEPGWEEYVVENALDLFQRRIGMIDCASNYDLYKSTETMQAKIEKYNFDSEKFWLLLLFLKDYTESCFGESYVFDSESMADNLKKMLNILESWNCELTISNNKESAHIDAMFIREELKELLLTLPQKTPINSYPCIGTVENNVLWHKVKFFMDMLDYFLDSDLPAYKDNSSGRKDWKFIAQILYIVGYLEDKKYLVGYEMKERILNDLDGGTKVVTEKIVFKGAGKYIKDNTKCCKVTPDCDKSLYCYNPVWNMID
jgi:hypothetical protein